jgi:hypothetical protein
MKTLKFIAIGMVIFLADTVQVKAEVNVNIYAPPLWGPVIYPEVRYYSLPGVEAYYDMKSSMFFYYEEGPLVQTIYLPPQYRCYDLYRGYHVMMIDYNGFAPYSYYYGYNMNYPRGHGGHWQNNFGGKHGRGNPYNMGNRGDFRNGGYGHRNDMKNNPGPGGKNFNGKNMNNNSGHNGGNFNGNNMKNNPGSGGKNFNGKNMNNKPGNIGGNGNNKNMYNNPGPRGGNYGNKNMKSNPGNMGPNANNKTMNNNSGHSGGNGKKK